jgi:hypothetical protein
LAPCFRQSVASAIQALFFAITIQRMGSDMPTITLSATTQGNGYQATVTFSDGVSISSAETYSTIAEAMTAAALKLLDMRERLEALDHLETSTAP